MAVNLSPYGGVGAQFLDNAGNVLTGGKIETYAAGTTTPQAVYTDATGITFHPNPIILDASGRVPSGGEIWLTDGLLYKFVLRDSNNVLIATYDNIAGINSNFVNFTNQQEIQTATAGQTVFTLTTTNYSLGTNSLSVFVDGVNQYGPGAQYAYVETNSTTVTFVNGLHVGASVKFTTSQLNSSGATDASQVSYTPAGTGAVTTTVQAKLRQYVSVQDFGAVGDGITDDSAAFIAARSAANGSKVYVPAGTYKLNSVISSSEDLIFEGDGPSTILDFTGAISGGNYALEATGTLTAIQSLSGTQTVGTNTVTFASPPSLIAGDVFVIYNPTNFSWSGFRSEYKAGEYCEVVDIVGSTVTVKNQLYDTYTAASVNVYKLTGPVVSLKNFTIKGTTILGLIKPTICINPLIENITATHENNSVVYLDRCFKPTVINPYFTNVGDGGDDYGIVVGSSQHCQIRNGYVYARRHAITHGGANNVGDVPTRDSRVIGVVLKNDIDSGVEAADFHGNTEDSSFIDCTIYNGGNLQGKDNSYVNCKITAGFSGYFIYHAEVKGGKLGCKNCDFISYKDPNLVTRALYDVGGNSNAITADTVLPTTFYVKDCTVYARNMGVNTSFMSMINRGSTQKLNVEVDGLTADVNSMNSILYTNLISGTANSDFIIVDRVSNFPTGTALHSAVGSNYLNFPHRCQKQTGYVSLTATSGTNITVSGTITFKYSYPRIPSAQATSIGPYNGNFTAYASVNSLAFNNLTVFISTGSVSTWNATNARPVNWTVSLDEV
jgi:hypothetical protein